MTALTVTALAVVGIGGGIISGAYQVQPTPASEFTTPAAVVLPCGAFADGAPSGDYVGGACYLPTTYHGYPTLDTAQHGTDIPRCASDDSNSDHVGRCYTERVTDGAVLLLDRDSVIITTLK